MLKRSVCRASSTLHTKLKNIDFFFYLNLFDFVAGLRILSVLKDYF